MDKYTIEELYAWAKKCGHFPITEGIKNFMKLKKSKEVESE